MTGETAYLLYFAFALGGAGVYFLLPRGEATKPTVGAMFGLGSLIALSLVLSTRMITPDHTTYYFYLFSTVAIAAAVRVITHPRPVYSALYFILVVISVSALLVLLEAEFLAVASIIVYAGAIMVTYLFVIMLAQQTSTPHYDSRSREPLLAVMAGFVLMAAMATQSVDIAPSHVAVNQARSHESRPVALVSDGATDESSKTVAEPLSGSNTLLVGVSVMTRYVVVLEISGVLLLVSMVGAIALSRKRVPMEGYRPAAPPLGQIGKEVEPF